MSDKPLKMEINLIVQEKPETQEGYECTAGVGVYKFDKDGEEFPAFERIVQDTKNPTEVMAYILDKYVVKKCFQWHNVTYDKDRTVMTLYGSDLR